MFLDSTTKTLEIILGSAKTTNDMPVTIDYVDITANTLTPGESDTVSNGLTAVTILASPAAGVQRKVNGLFVYNADTATKLVTIRLNNNSVLRPFVVANLSSGDTLGYTDTGGCYVTDSNGSRKVVASGSPNYLNKSAGVVTVGVSNCDYTTIQGALTANPTAGLLVLVYPGTYTDTINFTANGQCVVGMGTARQQNIQQVSANILNIGAFSNCRASNLTLTITAATSAVACVTGTTGTAEIVECNLNCTNSTVTAASQPALVNITGAGSVAIESGEYTYTNTVSDGTGVTAIKAAFVSGTGASITVNFPDNITITGSGQSLGTTLAFSSTSGNFIINRSFVSITDTGATVVAGYYYAGSGTTNEFGYNHITVNGGGANSVIGVYLNGTATLTSHFNHFFCSGGLTNYSFNIAAGNTINSYGDALNAASGYTGAGTIKVASSPSAGDWKVTGDFQQSQTPTATAAGTTQGTGTAVTTRTTVFTTVAAGAGGTLAAVTSAGVRRTIDNDGANPLLLYPPSGGAFSGYAVNTPVSIPVGGMVELESTSTINFDILFGVDNVAFNTTIISGASSNAAAAAGTLFLRGGQIGFPATQVPSTDPNTLDDYKEGTWTPAFTGSTGGTYTATINRAKYTKIGRLTYFLIDFTVTNVGTEAGYAQYTLPTTSANDGGSQVFTGREITVTGFGLVANNGSNSNVVIISKYDNTVLFGLNYRYVFQGFYE